MALFTQPEHVRKFLKCGFPRLDDYKNFDFDTIKASNSILWKKSENYNKTQIPTKYLPQIKIMRTAAYLVIKDEQILHEEYWLNFNKDSVMNSFSVAKSIVALLIGVAIQEGKIKSINQKVKEFLPNFSKGLNYKIRIVDLLSMSSSLSWNEDFANPNSDIVKAYYGTSLKKLICESYIEETPGKKWHYQCGNTVVLAMILEKVTGIKINEYVEQKLWVPLGATHDAYWGKDKPNGLTKAFCCFYATARDFAKLGLLVLNKGKYKGQQIVSSEFIKAIAQPADWLTFRQKPVDFYGLHFWLADYHNKKIPYFSGVLGQYIFIIPEQNAVVVRFGEMVNELRIQPYPLDVQMYLKVADSILEPKNQQVSRLILNSIRDFKKLRP